MTGEIEQPRGKTEISVREYFNKGVPEKHSNFIRFMILELKHLPTSKIIWVICGMLGFNLYSQYERLNAPIFPKNQSNIDLLVYNSALYQIIIIMICSSIILTAFETRALFRKRKINIYLMVPVKRRIFFLGWITPIILVLGGVIILYNLVLMIICQYYTGFIPSFDLVIYTTGLILLSICIFVPLTAMLMMVGRRSHIVTLVFVYIMIMTLSYDTPLCPKRLSYWYYIFETLAIFVSIYEEQGLAACEIPFLLVLTAAAVSFIIVDMLIIEKMDVRED